MAYDKAHALAVMRAEQAAEEADRLAREADPEAYKDQPRVLASLSEPIIDATADYEAAREALDEKDTPARRERYEAARDALTAARQDLRRAQGRQEGVGVNGRAEKTEG